MRAAGIDLREALPVGILRRYAARVDLRNHRKLAVIDGRIGYSGSQNIVDTDYGTRNLVWHDMMVRLTGPIILELLAVFVGDWYFTTNEFLSPHDLAPPPAVTGAIAAQVLPSGPNYPVQKYQRMVVAAIYGARKTVTITTPYLVPDAPFLQAMETAVLQGVEVRLIVPRRSNHPLVDAASRAYYDDMLDAGIELYLNDEGLLHAKTMSIDGEMAFIGSSNFDIRSFALDFEINLLFYDRGVAAQLDEKHRDYIAQSKLLTTEEWRQGSRAARFVRSVARLFSPLL
jgi:cardiolipin synthase